MKLVPAMMILNIQWIVISLLESSWSLCRINENRICTIEARIDSLIDKLWVKKYNPCTLYFKLQRNTILEENSNNWRGFCFCCSKKNTIENVIVIRIVSIRIGSWKYEMMNDINSIKNKNSEYIFLCTLIFLKHNIM